MHCDKYAKALYWLQHKTIYYSPSFVKKIDAFETGYN